MLKINSNNSECIESKINELYNAEKKEVGHERFN